MEKITVKSNAAKREITVNAPAVLSLSGQELLDMLGEKLVDNYLIDKLKIAFRAKIRSQLEKTGDDYISDEKILSEDFSEWCPEYREPKAINQKVLEAGQKMARSMRDAGVNDDIILTSLKGAFPNEAEEILASLDEE